MFEFLRRAGDDLRAVLAEPGEECRIAQHAVFQHFGIARAHFAHRQRVERGEIGEHQRRLVERADQILARRGVDRGLAADRTVDLRQQGGGQLHEAASALEDRAGEAGEIADHAAAQREDMIAARHAAFEQPVGQLGQFAPALGLLARFDRIPGDVVPGTGKRPRQPLAMVVPCVTIGDHRDRAARCRIGVDEFAQMRGRVIEQSVLDQHAIAAPGQFHIDHSHASIASIIRSTVR